MDLIKKLYDNGNQLLGEGYDKSLKEIGDVLPLDILEFPSGTQFGTWTVPQEWVVKDAWLKKDGVKICDYKEEPLSVMQYSMPFKGKIDKKELVKHLQYSDEMPDHLPYQFSFYEPKWGFSVKKEFVFKRIPDPNCDPEKMVCEPVFNPVETIADGDYEVNIDTELKPGVMKVGVHTIKGASDREILIFAHLDHPYQANDNLSSVQAVVDLAKKANVAHTIKIIFCPETIGSIAYASTQDISKVDFVIALECVGTDNPILVQKSFDKYQRINYAAHLALHELGITYSKGDFRKSLGSDEYMFNDPLIGIPGILVSRFLSDTQQPYKEYHTSADTPEIISEKAISEVVDYVLKVIEIYEKDYIPYRTEKGVLMRSKFGLQTPHELVNREMDYLWFDAANNEKYLSEIAKDYSMTFGQIYHFFDVLKKEGLIHEKKIVALILAKGDSKRLPKKNKIDFNGKPMFVWNLEKCKDIFDEVYVSSDDNYILREAAKRGAICIKRPIDLCGNKPNIPVYQHALGFMNEPDAIVAVQANSPTIDVNLIYAAKIIMKAGTDELITCHDDGSTYGSIWALSTRLLNNYPKEFVYDPAAQTSIYDSSVDIHTKSDLKRAKLQANAK